MPVDLFGNEIIEPAPARRSITGKKRSNTKAKGYAARPGTGPDGEKCKTCRHIFGNKMGSGRVFWKCSLMKHCWTGGRGSDVLVNSPACGKWEKGQ
jgi:hypothetical protein